MERGAVDAKRVKRSTPLEPRCAMYKKDRYKGWEEGARAVGIDGMGWRIGAGGLPCSFCSGGRVEMTHGWVAVGSRFSESLGGSGEGSRELVLLGVHELANTRNGRGRRGIASRIARNSAGFRGNAGISCMEGRN